MNATQKQILDAATLTAEIVASPYGTPTPTLRVRMPKNAHHRHLRVAMHLIAAELELAIPARESWPVSMDTSSDHLGTITLEMMTDKQEEAERAMQLLRACTTTS
jgi:hypothetical protein